MARCTVERLIRAMGLRGVVSGRETRTTVSNPATPCPADKVDRQFRASAPNVLWLSDFTGGVAWQGFVYVAFARVRHGLERMAAMPHHRLAGVADGPCRLCSRRTGQWACRTGWYAAGCAGRRHARWQGAARRRPPRHRHRRYAASARGCHHPRAKRATSYALGKRGAY